MQNTNNNEPIMVQIPETQEWIDVRPLVNFLKENEGPKQVEQNILNTIRTINTRFIFNSEWIEDDNIQKNLFERLYELKDLFGNFMDIKNR